MEKKWAAITKLPFPVEVQRRIRLFFAALEYLSFAILSSDTFIVRVSGDSLLYTGERGDFARHTRMVKFSTTVPKSVALGGGNREER
jgi:hypothetical protein